MTDSILTRLPSDIAAILGSVPALATANVLIDDAGDIESKVARALQTLTGTKKGLALVVMAPEVTSGETNLPGPPLSAQIEIQVIEHVLVNRDLTHGTLIRSATAALRVLGALHLAGLGDVLLYAEKDPIKVLPVKTGFVSHVVTLACRLDGIPLVTRCAAVTAAIVSSKLELATTTPAATIHYTTDSGLTWSHYTAPLALPAATVVRTFAAAATLNPGPVLELTITA